MLLVDIWIREMKEKIEGRHVGLEARMKNLGSGDVELEPGLHVEKPGLNLGPSSRFTHSLRSRAAPNPDRTWGFAKPTSQWCMPPSNFSCFIVMEEAWRRFFG